MKIDRVIISTTDHKKYIDFLPIVSKAWKTMGIKPTLVYTGKKQIKFDPSIETLNFSYKNINPIFVAQNIRLLVPSLYPNEVCILSDIDIMPLSKKYFFESIKKINPDNFVIYRPDACPPDMLALCFNASLGSTWGEIFEVTSVKDIDDLIKSWYPNDYVPFKKNWYFDQLKLREKVSLFNKNYPDRVTVLNDEITKFNRLNRDTLRNDMNKFINLGEYFTDFHMPRPYSLYKRQINKVYKKAFDEDI